MRAIVSACSNVRRIHYSDITEFDSHCTRVCVCELFSVWVLSDFSIVWLFSYTVAPRYKGKEKICKSVKKMDEKRLRVAEMKMLRLDSSTCYMTIERESSVLVWTCDEEA